MTDLARYPGSATVCQLVTDPINSAERMKRAATRELPDGVSRFLDHIDHDGIMICATTWRTSMSNR
jgi:hypothetical protein